MKSQVKRRRGARGIGPLIAVAFVVVATLIAGVRPAGAAEVGSADALSGVSARGGNYDDLLSADSGYTPESGGFSSNIGLSATLILAHDPKSPLKAGDTFSFGLVPDDEFAAKFWYVYNSDQMKFRSVLDENTDEEIATISWSSNNTLTLTFTEAAEGKSEVRCSFSSIPFTYTPRDIYNWFSANKDSERIHQTPEGRRYVDVTYHLTVNGQRTDRAMTLRVLEPKGSQPTSASIEKRRGGLQPDGTLYYEITVSTLLAPVNELVMYDTPDVNLHWDHKLTIYNMLGITIYGDKALSLDSATPYYNITKRSSDPSTAEVGDFQIWMYDVYFLADREGQEQTRQATYEEVAHPITHLDPRFPGERRELPEEFQTSISPVATPKSILVTVPAGQQLSAEQQRLIDETSAGGSKGLSSKDNAGVVGVGFKIVIHNLPNNVQDGVGGRYNFSYFMEPVRDSKFTDNENSPLYWNSSSYYIQEIPTCTSEDVEGGKQCVPISYEKSSASDANSRETSSTNVSTSVPSGKVTGSTKGGRVVVRYREKGTDNYLADPEVLVGATGDAYDALALKKDFPGYAFDSASPDFAPAQGAFANEPQTVVLEYVPIAYGSLIVRHIDHETGERLTDDVTSQHAVGEQYATQGRAFDGYELLVTPENARGAIVEGTATVTYEYARKKQPETKPEPKPQPDGNQGSGKGGDATTQASKRSARRSALPNTGEPGTFLVAAALAGGAALLFSRHLRRE